MASILEIDGKTLHPIKEAIKIVSYSRDYITRLAREKKITAVYVGRQWFVDLDSLKNYVDLISYEQEIRNKQLSEERKNEKLLREAIYRQNSLQEHKVKKFNLKAVAGAMGVLCFGLLSGFTLYRVTDFSQPKVERQVANTVDSSLDSKTIASKKELLAKESQSNSSIKEVKVEREVTPYFSREIDKIPVSDNGILLLPNAPVGDFDSANIFSDEVVIRTLDNGEQVVVRIDSEGNQVGAEIPWVVIPVKAKENNL